MSATSLGKKLRMADCVPRRTFDLKNGYIQSSGGVISSPKHIQVAQNGPYVSLEQPTAEQVCSESDTSQKFQKCLNGTGKFGSDILCFPFSDSLVNYHAMSSPTVNDCFNAFSRPKRKPHLFPVLLDESNCFTVCVWSHKLTVCAP